jgi:hypothetical protein
MERGVALLVSFAAGALGGWLLGLGVATMGDLSYEATQAVELVGAVLGGIIVTLVVNRAGSRPKER